MWIPFGLTGLATDRYTMMFVFSSYMLVKAMRSLDRDQDRTDTCVLEIDYYLYNVDRVLAVLCSAGTLYFSLTAKLTSFLVGRVFNV